MFSDILLISEKQVHANYVIFIGHVNYVISMKYLYSFNIQKEQIFHGCLFYRYITGSVKQKKKTCVYNYFHYKIKEFTYYPQEPSADEHKHKPFANRNREGDPDLEINSHCHMRKHKQRLLRESKREFLDFFICQVGKVW